MKLINAGDTDTAKTAASVKTPLNGAASTTAHHRRRRRNRLSWKTRQPAKRHTPPGVPRRAEAAVGQMGVGDSGTAQEIAHMAGFVSGAGDGGEGLRRRIVLPQRAEGAAQLSRRGAPPAAAPRHQLLQGHSGGGR